MDSPWSPSSWRSRPAAQQPDWPNEGALDDVLKRLAGCPPLVFAGEVRQLTSSLAEVADGQAFLLQAGDCAESFDWFSADTIRDKLKVILQMAVVLDLRVGRAGGEDGADRGPVRQAPVGGHGDGGTASSCPSSGATW